MHHLHMLFYTYVRTVCNIVYWSAFVFTWTQGTQFMGLDSFSMCPFLVARQISVQKYLSFHPTMKKREQLNRSSCVQWQCHKGTVTTLNENNFTQNFGLPHALLRWEVWSKSAKVSSGMFLWSDRCLYGLCFHRCCVYVWMDPGLTSWLMASVCMCENTPRPVSMLMSRSRWERGGWTNKEQTNQSPYYL